MFQIPGDKALGVGRDRDLKKWVVFRVWQRLMERSGCMRLNRGVNVVKDAVGPVWVDLESGAAQYLAVFDQNPGVHTQGDFI